MATWLNVNGDNVDSYCGSTAAALPSCMLYDGACQGGGWAHYANETHWLILDLVNSYTITKVRGRSDAGFDPINVNIYISNDKVSWGIPVAAGISVWQDTKVWQEIDTTETTGRYLKIEIVDTESSGRYLYWGWANKTVSLFDIYGEQLPPPEKPINPIPPHLATEVNFSDKTLSWDNGGGATSYDVYIGDAIDNLTSVSSGQTGESYLASAANIALFYGGLCYWRIDAINNIGTTTGNVWNFDARPVKPINPTPLHQATNVSITINLISWEDGATNAISYNVYFGTSPAHLTNLANGISSTQYIISDIRWRETYYWRIDAVNIIGITTGDIWHFTIEGRESWGLKKDACFVDSSLTYEGVATTTITGLGHLEGEEVQVLGNGAYLGTYTVSSAQITGLTSAITKAQVGLTMISKLQPMKLNGEIKMKRISEIILQLYESLGGKYGEDEDNLDTIVFRTNEMDDSPALYTGHKELPFDGSFNRRGDIIIKQSQPLPLKIVGIAVKFESELSGNVKYG